jgi:hypothetical protein
MLNRKLKQPQKPVAEKKAMHFWASAFFFVFTALPSITAQTNWMSGTAYGTNDLSLASSIESITNSSGSVSIGYSGTTNLSLSHDIEGVIVVSNRISGFSIDASGSSVTGSQFAVLTVIGGSNLTITGGSFIGTESEDSSSLPPVPGQSTLTNSDASAAMGGILYQVTNTLISGSTFSGTTFNSDTSTSLGTDGLVLLECSSVVISNATITGGNGDDVSNGTSTGGDALYIDSSSIDIYAGIYTGGSAGDADTSTGGAALYATNSTVEINGDATFTGGDDAAALYLRNSDLEVNGGTFTGGSYGTESYFSLVSIVESGQSNTIALNAGTFESIDFAGSGIQILTAGSDLTVDGYIVLDGSSLIVKENESDTAFQNLLLRSGDIQFLEDYTLSADGNLEFIFSTDDYSTLTADTATFESNSTITVDATSVSFDNGTHTFSLILTDNGIYVSTNNATTASLTNSVNIDVYTAGRTTYSGTEIDGNTLEIELVTESLGDYLDADGMFGDFVDELDSLITDEMDLVINDINDAETAGTQMEKTYFTTFNNFQTALQDMRAATVPSLSRSAEFREQLKLIPPGAQGPEPENRLRGWAKYYGHYYTHENEQLNTNYDTTIQGGVVGIDTSIGNLLIGLSGGNSHYLMSYDDNGESDVTAYHGSFYGTYGAERAYLDFSLGYGANEVDTRSADPFVMEGRFDANIISGYLGGGYDLIDLSGKTIFTPEASLQYAHYKQDAYTEESSTAVPRSIEAYEADSILGCVGMNVSMLDLIKRETFQYKADFRLHWMHEFSPDPSDLTFMLDGGSDSYQLTYPSLDEDIFRIGIGCSFLNKAQDKTQNVLFRIDFDELFGDGFNSHNLSAKVVYAF